MNYKILVLRIIALSLLVIPSAYLISLFLASQFIAGAEIDYLKLRVIWSGLDNLLFLFFIRRDLSRILQYVHEHKPYVFIKFATEFLVAVFLMNMFSFWVMSSFEVLALIQFIFMALVLYQSHLYDWRRIANREFIK